jgi:hypothetical protein
MSDKHTPEPWVIADHLGKIEGKVMIIGGGKGETGKPYAIAGIFDFSDEDRESIEEAKANAQRIVSCVNACAGLTQDELNFSISDGGIKKSVSGLLEAARDLEAQRNELLTMLEREHEESVLAGACMVIGDMMADHCKYNPNCKTCNFIAKVKGGHQCQ